MLIGFLLGTLGCSGTMYGGLPSQMTVASVLVLDSQRFLVAGYVEPKGMFGPVESREPRIFILNAGPAQMVWGQDKGWIVAADNRDGEIWIVRATLQTEGVNSSYDLLISKDQGNSWEEHGSIPATSIASIAIAGNGSGWAHGSRNLWYTQDEGQHWIAVSAPGTRSAAGECFKAISAQEALLGGKGLWKTTDQGLHWQQLSPDPISATDGQFVAGPHVDGFQVGQLQGDHLQWISNYAQKSIAKRIISQDQHLLILASLDRQRGEGILLLHSKDAGKTLTETFLRGPSDIASIGVQNPNEVVQVDLGRMLRVYAQ